MGRGRPVTFSGIKTYKLNIKVGGRNQNFRMEIRTGCFVLTRRIDTVVGFPPLTLRV